MNEHPTHEEREALIAGDLGALEPDEAAELALLADLLGDPSTWAEPASGLEDSVLDAVATAAPTRAPASAIAVAAGREPAPRRRRLALSAGAAAAAIAAIAVASLGVISSGSSADFTAQLGATSLATGAHASVDITHNRAGFRVVLDARALPKLENGQYYQAWLKNSAGTLVPIGTFSSSAGQVTLWSGVSPKAFPKMSVTIEAADNNQASSGRKVLTGDIRAN